MKKAKRNRYTYTPAFIRNDGIIFTEDTIDDVPIEVMKAMPGMFPKLLNSHSHLFPKQSFSIFKI